MGFWTFGYSNLIRAATTLWQTQMTACLRKQCWKLDLRQSYLMLTTHWKHQTGNISFPSNLVAFPERTLTHNSRRHLHAKCDKTDMDATINDITVTSYWAQRRLKSPASRLFTQTFIPLWGEFTDDRWIPAQRQVTRKMFPFDDVIMGII